MYVYAYVDYIVTGICLSGALQKMGRMQIPVHTELSVESNSWFLYPR